MDPERLWRPRPALLRTHLRFAGSSRGPAPASSASRASLLQLKALRQPGAGRGVSYAAQSHLHPRGLGAGRYIPQLPLPGGTVLGCLLPGSSNGPGRMESQVPSQVTTHYLTITSPFLSPLSSLPVHCLYLGLRRVCSVVELHSDLGLTSCFLHTRQTFVPCLLASGSGDGVRRKFCSPCLPPLRWAPGHHVPGENWEGSSLGSVRGLGTLSGFSRKPLHPRVAPRSCRLRTHPAPHPGKLNPGSCIAWGSSPLFLLDPALGGRPWQETGGGLRALITPLTPPSLSHRGLVGLLVGSCAGTPSPWALLADATSGWLISPCGSLHPAHLAVSSHSIRKTSLVIPAELLLVCCRLDRAGGRGQHPAPAKCLVFNSDDLDANPNATFYFQAARCLSAFASTSVKWV